MKPGIDPAAASADSTAEISQISTSTSFRTVLQSADVSKTRARPASAPLLAPESSLRSDIDKLNEAAEQRTKVRAAIRAEERVHAEERERDRVESDDARERARAERDDARAAREPRNVANFARRW